MGGWRKWDGRVEEEAWKSERGMGGWRRVRWEGGGSGMEGQREWDGRVEEEEGWI